ncbi:hypothetical protein ACH4OW_33810 [Streptomyces sp. NPDC017056]|uniref:hypothetical protein n=1 Tax=Streptomyces sp. NPDC017056 TaxID=3364973 RepID=UPI0037A8C3CD
MCAQYSARKAHEKAEWAHCGDLPLTWQMYVFAYGALLCRLGAVAAYVQLSRRAHRTPAILRRWRGTLALVSMLLGIFPLLGEAFIVWTLYQPAPGGSITCV